MKSRIMIVEDDLPLKLELMNILQKHNYDVIYKYEEIKDIIDAIEVVKPDLVLLDINLYGKNDGFQIAKYLNEHTKIPFIYITNYSDSSTLRRIQTTRPMGYLSKPFKETDVINNVAVAIYNSHISVNPDKEKSVLDKTEYADTYSPNIKHVLDYIDNHLNAVIETSKLVEISGWSQYHFIRKFNDEVGLTPRQYIIEKKLEEVKKLLINTDLSVQDIAIDLGFNSTSSLSQVFKKRYHKTPLKYRKSMI